MIAGVGFGATLLALGGALIGLWAVRQAARGQWSIQPAIAAAEVTALAAVGANVVMMVGLAVHDISISYVAQVGSRSTPLLYTFTALWSALDGSILLWAGLLSVVAVIYARRTTGRDRRDLPVALGVLFALIGFFAFVVLVPGNPWATVSPVPLDGPGPNPLLANDPLVAIHPPLLYLGLVGMAVPFALTIAALWRGSLDDRWLTSARRWTFLPWVALTAGLVLGGLWSYAVLGWGGYWAWDPVENVALLPWLTATAFLHSSMVAARRGSLRSWNVSLVIGSFGLTILATLMTRSGILDSVHAFTESTLGPLFLGLLALIVVGSVALAGLRLPSARSASGRLGTRAGAILLNNLIFLAVAATVLFGTIFPLLAQAVGGQQISVGAPYFDRIIGPFAVGLLVLLGIGPTLPWGDWTPAARRRLLPGAAAAVAASVALVILDGRPMVIAAGSAACFALVESCWLIGRRILSLGRSARSSRATRHALGGLVAHAGVAVIALAILGSATGGSDVTASVGAGQAIQLGDIRLVLDRIMVQPEALGRVVVEATGSVASGRSATSIAPTLTLFTASGTVVAGPAILPGPLADIYVTLTNVSVDAKSATVRLARYPFLSWLWVGGLILAAGGLLAAWPERRRARSVIASAPVPAAADTFVEARQ